MQRDDDEAGANDIQSLLNAFAALRVSRSALEESLGLDVTKAGEADIARLHHILAFMTHDKLTLGKAIAAAKKGARVPAPAAQPAPAGEKKKKTTAKKPAAKAAKQPAPASAAPAESESAPAPEARKKPVRRVLGKEKLLIVESPAKAKTIKKFLGGDFVVKASMGHVRDIPSKGRDRSDIGIDFQNRYQPYYVPIESREKVIKELRAAADKAAHVYLAPDPDREGEAIA
ncbi:MAG: hypothetical protein LBS30_00830, partial [Planctomycetota bacterium]|nr:hypothetical protein [Planctomycetota bacterium]